MPPIFKGIVVALLAVAIVATLMLLAPLGRRAPAEAEPARAAAARALDQGSRGLRWITGGAAARAAPFSLAPLDGPLDPALLACQARLRRLHQELIDLEADLVEWDDDFLYALGEGNPGAEQALAPLVVSLLTDARWRLLEHSFRCRTWACRVVVRFDQPRPNSAMWSAWRLRQKTAGDPEIAARARVSLPQGPVEEREGSFVYMVQLRLRQPSAAPRPGAPLAPPVRALALPTTAASCESAAATAARENPGAAGALGEGGAGRSEVRAQPGCARPRARQHRRGPSALVHQPARHHRVPRPRVPADQPVPPAGPHVLGQAHGGGAAGGLRRGH
jgi:hypothetical protein